MRNLERLPDAELEVMQALWQLEPYPVTSAQLMERLSGRHWRLPTLLKLLSRLEERGFVESGKEGRSNRYRPLVNEREYLAAESGRFFQKLHGGSLPSLVAALVESRSLTPDDVAQLEAILKGEEKR